MLNGATQFPHAGSYCLLLSPAPPAQQRQAGDPQPEEIKGPQLVRIIRHFLDRTALVSLPLLDGASGTRTVPCADLLDATPLTAGEGRRMIDLGRELRQKRVLSRAEKQALHDALKRRAIYAPLLAAKLRELAARERRKAA